MFHNSEEFLLNYGWESDVTAKVLGALTDESLSQSKAEGHPGLGDIAWHIATAPEYMLSQSGFDFVQPDWATPENLTAQMICDRYNDVCNRIKEQAATKSPEDLQKFYHVFGMMDWPMSAMLNALIVHEAHHRGQISVLMRQAGLVVPSIYGPNYEETQQMMAQLQEGNS